MGTPYSHSGYSVLVEDDGAIQVKAGDWLSKYSMAIHHDLNHVKGCFGRRKPHPNGSISVITNVDLIRTGEIVYHLETHKKWKRGGGKTPIEPGKKPPPEETTENVSSFLQWLFDRFVKTDWKVIGSGSIDGSFLFFTGQRMTLRVEQKSVGTQTRFSALAGGLTLGFPSEGATLGGSIAPPRSPFGVGSIVRFAWRHQLTIKDFRHGIVVVEIGGAFPWFVGGSLTFVIFGLQFPAILLRAIFDFFWDGDLLALQTAFKRTVPAGVAILLGANVGTPGISIAGRAGAMYDRR